MKWFVFALQRYAVFSGRSQRSEYWYFLLFYLLVYVAFLFVDALIGMYSKTAGIGLLSGVFSLAMMIPSLAVSVRRLHDTGRSGWWVLIGLVPLIGAIVLLVFFAQDGEAGTNEYGENPKAGA